MSDLVCVDAQSTRDEIEDLLLSDEPDDHYTSLFDRLSGGPADVEQLNCLIVTISLKQFTGWDRYVMEECTSYPSRLLHMLTSPHDTVCETRRQVAAELLGTNDDFLVSWDSDLSYKMKICYHGCFRHAARTGLLARPLHAVLLTFRAIYPHDTHAQEGWMSILKTIGTRAPNMRLPLANSRLSSRLGPRLTVDTACDFHSSVVEYMGSDEAVARHNSCVLHTAVPDAGPLHPHGDRGRLMTVAGLATACGSFLLRGEWVVPNKVRLSARFVCRCTFEDPPFFRVGGSGAKFTAYFIPISSHYSQIDCVVGVTSVGDGGGLIFRLRKPIVNQSLASLLRDLDPSDISHRSMCIERCRLNWLDGQCACVAQDTAELKQIAVSTRARKRRRVDGPCPLPENDGDDAEEWSLEEELTKLLEEEGVAQEDAVVGGPDGGGADDRDEDLSDDGDEAVSEAEAAHADRDDVAEALVDAAEHPYQRADAEAVHRGFATLINKCADFVLALDDARGQAATHNAHAIVNGTISLIMSSHSAAAAVDDDVGEAVDEKVLHFVRWTNVALRKGRPITLDVLNRVVCIVACKVGEDEYGTAEILISQVPAVMLQRRGAGRDRMPDWVMLYARFVSAQHCSGPLPLDGDASRHRLFMGQNETCECGLCAVLGDEGVDVELRREAIGAMFVCHRCLVYVHRRCSVYSFHSLAAHHGVDATVVYNAFE